MFEKRLLNCIMIEGIMLMVLSLCILIIPKLTTLSYGVMLSGALITYGIYKIIHSIVNKNYGLGKIFCITMGVFLAAVGILILFVPKINLLWLIALIGVYFLLESISSIVHAFKFRSAYHFWGCKLVSAVILFLIGLIIILGLPVISFWMVTMLSGTGLLLKGMSKLIISLSNYENYTM